MQSFFLYPLLLSLAIFAGCSNPETPQEATEAFWQAVLEGDASDAARYSTLVNDTAFDRYSRDWNNITTTWGRVVIEGDEASVVTILNGLEEPADGKRQVTTYLVKVNDQWLVDYYRTGDSVSSQRALDRFVGQLEALSQQLADRFARESESAAQELEQLSRELETFSGAASEEFSRRMDAVAKELEKSMEAMARSIEQAIEENRNASPADRRTLNEAAIRLQRQKDRVSETSLQSVANRSATLAETQRALNRIGDQFADYKARWEQQLVGVQKEIRKAMTDPEAH